MDIFDGIRVVTRWWFITGPLLVLSLLVALLTTGHIDPEYTAEGSVLFVGPNVSTAVDSGISESVNPLLVQPSSLTTAAEVAAISANTPQVADLLDEQGFSTDYHVTAQGRSPIVQIQTRADSRELATSTAVRLVEIIDRDIRLRQDAADAPEDQRVTTTVIGLSAIGGADYGGRNRLRLVLFILGVAGAFAAAFAADGIQRRRDMKLTSSADDSGEIDERSDLSSANHSEPGDSKAVGSDPEIGDHVHERVTH